MINFINTCDILFLKGFFGLDCAFKAQKWCAERGVEIDVSEELAQWMEENMCLVNDTWAARTKQKDTTPSRQKKRVVKIVVLADGSHAEEVSWV